MDWNAERTRQAWRRIVALLFLFAALAERAARSPWPARRPVLWILRRAESVAREFVTGEAGEDLPWQGDAAEATRLALSFRALAFALDAEAAQTEPSARHRPERDACDIALVLHGFVHRVPAPDTS